MGTLFSLLLKLEDGVGGLKKWTVGNTMDNKTILENKSWGLPLPEILFMLGKLLKNKLFSKKSLRVFMLRCQGPICKSDDHLLVNRSARSKLGVAQVILLEKFQVKYFFKVPADKWKS